MLSRGRMLGRGLQSTRLRRLLPSGVSRAACQTRASLPEAAVKDFSGVSECSSGSGSSSSGSSSSAALNGPAAGSSVIAATAAGAATPASAAPPINGKVAAAEWRRQRLKLAEEQRESAVLKALSAVRSGKRKSTGSFNAAMAGCRHIGRPAQALALWEQMRQSRVPPDVESFQHALVCAMRLRRHKLALELWQELVDDRSATAGVVEFTAAMSACERLGEPERVIEGDRTHQPWFQCGPHAHQPRALCDPRAHRPWTRCEINAWQALAIFDRMLEASYSDRLKTLASPCLLCYLLCALLLSPLTRPAFESR